MADIKDLREYEREREDFRSEIIATKKRRRIPVGDLTTMVFENAATMRFQIQEMARAERMLRDEVVDGQPEDVERLTRSDITTTVHYLKWAFTLSNSGRSRTGRSAS